ncbi:OmpA/MotB family protein [Solitalea lacus]|uniref:OmpA/MotB family protein n=1 Tax=Solitalea lacus TaxID=2911172 RepID=UPI001EDAA5F6|nr:OmpA family protein [Solitalea lacus]UKJ07395.1 OmpA family protein [Solitalea lacus]
MKRTFIVPVMMVSSVIGLTSCVALSKKDYRKLIAERDSLQNTLADCGSKGDSLQALNHKLKGDTSNLGDQLRLAQEQNELLFKDYTALRNNSSGEIKKLSADLAARERNLREVEAILKSRDEATNALQKKLSKALLGFSESGLTVSVKDGKVFVSLTDKLLFDTGSIIIDTKGKEALDELAKVLKTQPDINILVEGHTDNAKVRNLGQIKDNWDLSVLRATSVVRYLTEVQKLEPIKLEAAGRGEFIPVTMENTTEAKSKNRRIEIILSPKLDEIYKLLQVKN